VAGADVDAAIAACDAWFIRRGLPHLIESYSASRDILTRATPALTAIFLIELFTATKSDWPWWANLLALLAAFAIALGGWAMVNRWRGRRPLARPVEVGVAEVAVFVLVPALLPAVFGQQLRQAVVTALVNVVLLVAIFAGTSYGVVPMTRWAIGRMGRQVGDLFNLLVRALPLLLVFVMFLFLNAEVWQASSTLNGTLLGGIAAAFVVIGIAFVVARLPREIGQLAKFDSWDDTRRLVADSPLGTVCAELPPPSTPTPDLSRRQWGNVGLLVLFGQALQILTVTLMVGVFLFALGVVMVSPSTIATWTQADPHVLADLTLAGRASPITEELLKVTTFLTCFTGLYFTVVMLTDQAYREEFLDDVEGEVREALAVRAAYLVCRGDA
jgi:hypothetical protein